MTRITSTLAILAATTATVFAQSGDTSSRAAEAATKDMRQTRVDFKTSDTNQDGTLDSGEMKRVSSSMFDRWDIDHNKRLTGDEFAYGLHDAWANEDGVVDKGSFATNWGHWFNVGQPEFDSADKNKDNQLSFEELRDVVNGADFQGRWKAADDQYMTEKEFRTGLTNVHDRDGSGTLDEAEFGTVLTVVGVVIPDQEQTASTTGRSGDATMSAAATDASARDKVKGVSAGKIVPLASWSNDGLYQNGWSAEEFFGATVVSEAGEEIGDVEDLVVSSDGKLLSVVAEVGGIWDIGDTHVSVPWDKVTIREDGSVQIPVTEDNVDQYGFFNTPSAESLKTNVVSGLDDEDLGPRAWRASELIGDLARIRNSDMRSTAKAGETAKSDDTATDQQALGTRPGRYDGYGYVEDLIIKDGKIAATVIGADAGYGAGRRAYPFYGYPYGWNPGARYYDLPYTSQEANKIVPFDYEKLNRS